MAVSLLIQSTRAGLKKNAEELLRFARRARTAVGLRGTVGVLIESDERMRAMNRYFRRKDKPTDVLAFPAAPNIRKQHAGDIAISADIAAENASVLGHSTADEIKILILHGMLHLAGHDHETDSGKMAGLERGLRAQMRLPGSLIERSAGAKATPAKKRASSAKPARIKLRTPAAKLAREPASRKKSSR
jgi:probable rRNA maturation factor